MQYDLFETKEPKYWVRIWQPRHNAYFEMKRLKQCDPLEIAEETARGLAYLLQNELFQDGVDDSTVEIMSEQGVVVFSSPYIDLLPENPREWLDKVIAHVKAENEKIKQWWADYYAKEEAKQK